MFSRSSRMVLCSAHSSLASGRNVAARRLISTEPPHLRGRSWKSSAARWGIAIAGIYYYNTSPVFAEQPSNNLLNPNLEALEESTPSTLETLTSRRHSRSQKNASVLESAVQTTSSENASHTSMPVSTDPSESTTNSSPSELEQEAEGQGAFNEETGEINWDCPCLGGMAHGPCGPEFREAFSCFVFSKEEPKGMDCIDKFKGMQDCFQKYPEVYKGELEDDDDLDSEAKAELQGEITARRERIEVQKQESSGRRLLEEPDQNPIPASSQTLQSSGIAPTPSSTDEPQSKDKTSIPSAPPRPQSGSKVLASPESHPGTSEEHESINEGQSSTLTRTPKPPPVTARHFDEDLELMPKAWHDARPPSKEDKKIILCTK